MKNYLGGFIVFAIFFGLMFGWTGLLVVALGTLSLWFSDLSESETPVSAEKGKSSREDDLAMSIIAATCGNE